MTEEIPDDWDPLTEEYCSVSFNTYNEGPGVNLPLEDLPAFSKYVFKITKVLSLQLSDWSGESLGNVDIQETFFFKPFNSASRLNRMKEGCSELRVF